MLVQSNKQKGFLSPKVCNSKKLGSLASFEKKNNNHNISNFSFNLYSQAQPQHKSFNINKPSYIITNYNIKKPIDPNLLNINKVKKQNKYKINYRNKTKSYAQLMCNEISSNANEKFYKSKILNSKALINNVHIQSSQERRCELNSKGKSKLKYNKQTHLSNTSSNKSYMHNISSNFNNKDFSLVSRNHLNNKDIIHKSYNSHNYKHIEKKPTDSDKTSYHNITNINDRGKINYSEFSKLYYKINSNHNTNNNNNNISHQNKHKNNPNSITNKNNNNIYNSNTKIKIILKNNLNYAENSTSPRINHNSKKLPERILSPTYCPNRNILTEQNTPVLSSKTSIINNNLLSSRSNENNMNLRCALQLNNIYENMNNSENIISLLEATYNKSRVKTERICDNDTSDDKQKQTKLNRNKKCNNYNNINSLNPSKSKSKEVENFYIKNSVSNLIELNNCNSSRAEESNTNYVNSNTSNNYFISNIKDNVDKNQSNKSDVIINNSNNYSKIHNIGISISDFKVKNPEIRNINNKNKISAAAKYILGNHSNLNNISESNNLHEIKYFKPIKSNKANKFTLNFNGNKKKELKINLKSSQATKNLNNSTSNNTIINSKLNIANISKIFNKELISNSKLVKQTRMFNMSGNLNIYSESAKLSKYNTCNFIKNNNIILPNKCQTNVELVNINRLDKDFPKSLKISETCETNKNLPTINPNASTNRGLDIINKAKHFNIEIADNKLEQNLNSEASENIFYSYQEENKFNFLDNKEDYEAKISSKVFSLNGMSQLLTKTTKDNSISNTIKNFNNSNSEYTSHKLFSSIEGPEDLHYIYVNILQKKKAYISKFDN